jgi:translation elongation factor EF-G
MRLGHASARMMIEDPAVRVKTDQATGEVVIGAISEPALEIVVDRLKRSSTSRRASGVHRSPTRER